MGFCLGIKLEFNSVRVDLQCRLHTLEDCRQKQNWNEPATCSEFLPKYTRRNEVNYTGNPKTN